MYDHRGVLRNRVVQFPRASIQNMVEIQAIQRPIFLEFGRCLFWNDAAPAFILDAGLQDMEECSDHRHRHRN